MERAHRTERIAGRVTDITRGARSAATRRGAGAIRYRLAGASATSQTSLSRSAIV